MGFSVMSSIIAFPHARLDARQPADISALATRLVAIERSGSQNEEIMDLVIDAEEATLAALAAAPAHSYADATVKLATVVRRIGADSEAFLAEGDLTLLRSALRDLRRLEQTVIAAQA
jgi:hypothetical protein